MKNTEQFVHAFDVSSQFTFDTNGYYTQTHEFRYEKTRTLKANWMSAVYNSWTDVSAVADQKGALTFQFP